MKFFTVSFFRNVWNFGRESVFLIVLSILLADVVAFLIWKDRSGRTVVYSSLCPYLSDLKGSKRACRCPKRLAFRAVDSLIAKRRAILTDNSRGTDWHSVMDVGNPVKWYSIDFL